jgi:hypothetical protein
MFDATLYLKLERRQTLKKDGSKSKTPRYVVTAHAGHAKWFEALKNAKNEIVMYYQRNDKCNPHSKSETRLQCKDSINFSSIYLLDMKIAETLIGYGEPPMTKTFEKKGKDGKIIEHPNHFYDDRNDGYLFIITPTPDTETTEVVNAPKTIEIIVVHNGRYLIQGAAKELIDGQFNEGLEQIRKSAKSV